MILVCPFCAKDGAIALKNLLWMEELDGRLPFDVVLSHDDQTPASMVQDMKVAANRIFQKADTFWYPAPEKKHWPAAPNWAWQNVARYMAAIVKKPWLFLEADAVPIRKGWLRDIAVEHYRAGLPFSGHFVDQSKHMNGVGVYPPDVAKYSVGAFRTEETAWDVVLGKDLSLQEGGSMCYVHPSHTLFQLCWAVNPADGKAWYGNGEVASFKSFNDLLRIVDTTMAVFHRCKDGSLIDWLRQYHKDPSAAMVPQHTYDNNRPENGSSGNIHPEIPTMESELPKLDEAKWRVGGNVDAVDVGVGKGDSKPSPGYAPFTGTCEILIVTYGLKTKRVSGIEVSDFDWLTWCLRSIRRHCQQFAGVTLVIPSRDASLLAPIANEHAQAKGGIKLRIRMMNEKPGKGMLQHMTAMASADELVPKNTTHVLHVDADVIFKEAVTPDEYFDGDKAIYVVRTYDSLIEQRDGQKVVSDCHQWKGPTAAQLGFEPEVYTMLRHPEGFPIGFYKKYRDHITAIHGKEFMDYMLEGKNSFPQTRMDFTAMGAFAHKAMHDAFTWLDVSGGNHLAPKDKCKTWWSHGGLTPHIKAEIEGFLK